MILSLFYFFGNKIFYGNNAWILNVNQIDRSLPMWQGQEKKKKKVLLALEEEDCWFIGD